MGLAIALAFEPMLSAFFVWRIVFVSTLFVIGVFGIFERTHANGSTLEEARTHAVNTLTVMEVSYLFSVRYLRAPSLTLKEILGTRAVLVAVAVVISLQLIFTYAPFMVALFDARPVDFVHGAEIIGVGVALFAILEIEKWLRMQIAAPRCPPSEKHPTNGEKKPPAGWEGC